MKTNDSIDEFFEVSVGGGMMLALFGSVGILIFQTYEWLRDRFWTPFSNLRLLKFMDIAPSGNFNTGWKGVDKILESILSAPLSGSCFIAGAGFAVVMMAIYKSVFDN